MLDGEDVTNIVFLVFMGLAVVVPIVGVTARFALRPIVEALVTLRASGRDEASVQMLERRMALLEQEVRQVDELRTQVARLTEERDFQRQLAAPHPDAAAPAL